MGLKPCKEYTTHIYLTNHPTSNVEGALPLFYPQDAILE